MGFLKEVTRGESGGGGEGRLDRMRLFLLRSRGPRHSLAGLGYGLREPSRAVPGPLGCFLHGSLQARLWAGGKYHWLLFKGVGDKTITGDIFIHAMWLRRVITITSHKQFSHQHLSRHISVTTFMCTLWSTLLGHIEGSALMLLCFWSVAVLCVSHLEQERLGLCSKGYFS